MESYDIKSLFTNIPLTKTLNYCGQNFYRNQTHVGNFLFHNLLKNMTFGSFFICDRKFYEQCDHIAMGFPLGPTLANVFASKTEENGSLLFVDINIQSLTQ